MGLNPKQIIFVKEYLVDKNATRAAKAAGYSVKTAHSTGAENLTKPEIASAIAEGFRAQVKAAEGRAAKRGVTRDRWMRELELIGFANMDDFATVDESSSGAQHVNLVTTMERKKGRGHAIKKLTETQTQHGGSLGIELHGKLPALEIIGKAYGWVKDQVEHSGAGGAPQVVLHVFENGSEALSDDEGEE